MRRPLTLLLLALAGCGNGPPALPPIGDADNGKLLLRQFGCGTCHQIPGVADAKGRHGPPLAGIGSHIYIAGTLPNTPANLARFIREPARHAPGTLMPDLGVGEVHANDMAAYLAGLR